MVPGGICVAGGVDACAELVVWLHPGDGVSAHGAGHLLEILRGDHGDLKKLEREFSATVMVVVVVCPAPTAAGVFVAGQGWWGHGTGVAVEVEEAVAVDESKKCGVRVRWCFQME